MPCFVLFVLLRLPYTGQAAHAATLMFNATQCTRHRLGRNGRRGRGCETSAPAAARSRLARYCASSAKTRPVKQNRDEAWRTGNLTTSIEHLTKYRIDADSRRLPVKHVLVVPPMLCQLGTKYTARMCCQTQPAPTMSTCARTLGSQHHRTTQNHMTCRELLERYQRLPECKVE